VPYIEIAGSLRDSSVWKREVQTGDGAHPGSEGYSLLAQLIMKPWLAWLSTSPTEA
jgi:lysophospholipase L1-like esterase